ncbi:hypothetical protein C0J52_03389 [Blattella germanica]|nr:hypothetical protein C0J52_03389 [Blattella germanica]
MPLVTLFTFQDGEWNEDMETDMCLLWDMTIEPDVVALLMKHNFLQVSTNILKWTSEPRPMEVLLGIIANMSCEKEVRNELLSNEDYINILSNLFDYTDTMVLIQLMRVLQAMAYDVYIMKVSSDGDQTGDGQDSQEKCSDECLFMQKFMSRTIIVEKIVSLLTNSRNKTVQGILEGLRQIYKGRGDDSLRWQKAVCHGTEILASFTSFTAGKEVIGKFKEFTSKILHKFLPIEFSPNSMSNDLFMQLLSTMTVIYSLLDAGFFDPLVFNRLLCYLVQLQGREERCNEDSCQEILERLRQYFKMVVQHSDRDTVAAALQKCSTVQVKILQGVMET